MPMISFLLNYLSCSTMNMAVERQMEIDAYKRSADYLNFSAGPMPQYVYLQMFIKYNFSCVQKWHRVKK